MSKKIILCIVAVVALVAVIFIYVEAFREHKTTETKPSQEQPLSKDQALLEQVERMRKMHQRSLEEQGPPMPPEFDEWFKELSTAYQKKDNKKVGQLIEKMNQDREKLQQILDTRQQRRQQQRSTSDNQ